jgi:hypothetical protein
MKEVASSIALVPGVGLNVPFLRLFLEPVPCVLGNTEMAADFEDGCAGYLHFTDLVYVVKEDVSFGR